MQEEELQRLVKKFSRWMKETEEEMGHDEFQNMLSSWANLNLDQPKNPESIANIYANLPTVDVLPAKDIEEALKKCENMNK